MKISIVVSHYNSVKELTGIVNGKWHPDSFIVTPTLKDLPAITKAADESEAEHLAILTNDPSISPNYMQELFDRWPVINAFHFCDSVRTVHTRESLAIMLMHADGKEQSDSLNN